MAKLRVLLSAYSCYPNSGSEPGNGWNWSIHLAEAGMLVTVLTTTDNQERIEAELKLRPRPFVDFRFVEMKTRLVRESSGMHYLLWQWAAVSMAESLGGSKSFDIVHHVTLGSIHVPSQLWRLGLPVVFGPVGGGQVSPESMLSYFGPSKWKEQVRTLFTRCLPYSPLHRLWIRRMKAVLATNTETLDLARRLGSKNASMYFDPGVPESYLAPSHRVFTGVPNPLRLIWVGRMLPRKAIGLTLDILAKAQCPSTLAIVGGGLPQEVLRDAIQSRGLQERVTVSGGQIPWQDVRNAYMDYDALLFTSLRDSCAAQLLEAMATGLPLITLDLHGGGDMMPDTAGIKIPVSDVEGTVRSGEDAVERYARLSDTERSAMSKAALEFARTMTWPVRAQFAQELYHKILAGKNT